MTNYLVVYIDRAGKEQIQEIASTDVRTAMDAALKNFPAALRITRCYPKPLMSND